METQVQTLHLTEEGGGDSARRAAVKKGEVEKRGEIAH